MTATPHLEIITSDLLSGVRHGFFTRRGGASSGIFRGLNCGTGSSDQTEIGAAHAGWRGALDGILDATLDAMEALGATRENIHAVIGPSISQRAYEVGPEFAERFFDEDHDNTRFFANGAGDRYLFDLPGYGLARLRAAGVGQAEWTRHCTFSDAERFYSYRRATHRGEVDYGRLISTIRL